MGSLQKRLPLYTTMVQRLEGDFIARRRYEHESTSFSVNFDIARCGNKFASSSGGREGAMCLTITYNHRSISRLMCIVGLKSLTDPAQLFCIGQDLN